MTAMPLVDAHAHVFSAHTPLAPGAWHRPAAEATVEQFLAVLDAHGVQRAVLAAASIYGTNNDDALEACRNPRLRTTVILDPGCPASTLRAMAASGVVGVRLQWRNVAETPDLSSPVWQQCLRRMVELDWHVELHDDSARLARPLELLEAAGVKIVVDHFGRPDARQGTRCPGFQRLLRSVETGRTWVKLSAGFRLATPGLAVEAAQALAVEAAQALAVEAAQALLRHAGPERLMWGSDWPFAAFESTMSYDQALAGLAAWVPDAEDRRRIGSDTPLAFYFAETQHGHT
ncbi:MAG: amidohydrolase family protein [Rhizobacter sp.]|nr:amidohydrolase family protein [Rhizobacter sp.]